MIETAEGVLAAPQSPAKPPALIAGTNDLAADLRLPPEPGASRCRWRCSRSCWPRAPQGIAVFDGVFNRLDDLDGFAAEAAEGRRWASTARA